MASDDRTRTESWAGLADLSVGLAFLTRLRWPPERGPVDLRRAADAAWTFPIVGAGIGLVGGIAVIVAVSLGLPTLVGGLLAVLVAASVGGAGERGLAGVVDGAGAATPADRLTRSAQDRLGSAGGLAIILAVTLRAATLAGFVFLGEAQALFVLVGAESLSRAAMARPWHALPPASGAATAGPDERATTTALAIGALIAAVVTMVAVGFWSAVVALAGTAAAILVFESWWKNRFGGFAPAALWACQQIVLVTYLLLALAFA